MCHDLNEVHQEKAWKNEYLPRVMGSRFSRLFRMKPKVNKLVRYGATVAIFIVGGSVIE